MCDSAHFLSINNAKCKWNMIDKTYLFIIRFFQFILEKKKIDIKPNTKKIDRPPSGE